MIFKVKWSIDYNKHVKNDLKVSIPRIVPYFCPVYMFFPS